MYLWEAIKELTECGGEFSNDGVTIKKCLWGQLLIEKKEPSYNIHLSENWKKTSKPEIEEITADEAMKRLEEQSGKKVKIIR
jgi:hypothetical protein